MLDNWVESLDTPIGNSLSDFVAGNRVQISPDVPFFGGRYGEVVYVGRQYVSVAVYSHSIYEVDAVKRVLPNELRHVISDE